jgi:hypothetical protein
MIRRSRLAGALVRELAEVGPKFPERGHMNALVDRFVIEIMTTTLRWADWAEEIVDGWSETKLDDAMARQTRELLRENADAVEAMAARGGLPDCEPVLTSSILRGLRKGGSPRKGE